MKQIGKKAGIGLLGIAGIAACVALVMVLWNALVPEIFGGQPIGYWQALGLMLLARLLLGRFGRPFAPRNGHRHLHEAMRGMSREEKQEFIRRRMRGIARREETAGNGGEA